MLRDHNGGFRAAACSFVDRAPSAEMVEVEACKRAIQLASEANVQNLHVELDCLGVVAAINKAEQDLSILGPSVEEIKQLLNQFLQVKVTWTKREANGAADKLAKIGLGDEVCNVWWVGPPESIIQVLSDEIPSYV